MPVWYTRGMGEKLKKARLAKGLTQLQAAELVGVEVNTWARWEQGVRFPSRDLWAPIAEALGVAIRDLM